MKTAIMLVSLLFVIAPAANAGSGDVKSTNILKLSCSMGQSSFIVNVDLVSCTANGFPANINEDTISWTVPGEASVSYTINRYTGDISRNMPPFNPSPAARERSPAGVERFMAEYGAYNEAMSRWPKPGKCHKVSEKQF